MRQWLSRALFALAVCLSLSMEESRPGLMYVRR